MVLLFRELNIKIQIKINKMLGKIFDGIVLTSDFIVEVGKHHSL